MKHKTRYFSEVHASKDSQLFGTAVEVQDSPQITELQAALADYPKDYNLHIQLAGALGNQLRYREAIELLSAAITLEPENPVAYRKRAPRYFSTLQFETAYSDYSYCDRQNPGTMDVLYRLGILCVAMRRYEEAKRCMARCIELTESDGEMQVASIYWYLAAWVRCHSENEPNLGAAAYHSDMEVGHHFAYKAGVELLCGLKTPEETLAVIDDSVDDLDHSMILYGIYLYHISNGNNEAAQSAMDRLLARDYYWAGFAYIAAYADRYGTKAPIGEQLPTAVPASLYEYFKQNQNVALAFSGGADSAYLLYAAKASGCNIKAYYVSSAFQPRFELEDAEKLAKQLDVPMEVITLDVLANEVVRANPANRCYYCKSAVFGQIVARAAADGFSLLMDGTNASDDVNDRPGMRALAELSVSSPLREAGITKAQLREYSRKAGLFTWDKPSYACLATRIPTGTAIDPDTLHRVEQGEQYLALHGFTDFRLRVMGNTAKLQLTEEQFPLLMQHRSEVYKALSEQFAQVVLDLMPRVKGD